MDRSYSILFLSHRGTRIRRLLTPRWAICSLISAATIFITLYGALTGHYLWLRTQLEREIKSMAIAHEQIRALKAMHEWELAKVNGRVRTQRKKLLSLREQVTSSQQLLANWKDLRQKVRASLPRKKKSLLSGQELVEELQNGISSLHGDLEGLIASIPSKWPTKGWISSGFGNRPSPWTGKKDFHSGIDIANHRGTPVHAPGDGMVQFAGRNGGSGKNIVLNHGQGITTHYGHLSKILVKKGDHVRKEQQIAKVGNTGKSTNPHLHYEIRVGGTPINPRRHLLKK